MQYRKHKIEFRIGDSYVQSDIQIILLYGNYTLYEKDIREMMDVKIFIDLDNDVRLSRQVEFISAADLEGTMKMNSFY